MADTNLKVTKVYMYNRKQVGFIISLSIGIVSSYSKIMLKSRDNFISLIDKIKCANATVSKSGVVKVSSDVPRENISKVLADRLNCNNYDENLIKVSNGDLKVTKVFVQGNEKVGFRVMRADGSYMDASIEQMIQAKYLGHVFSNAEVINTISNPGVVRVSFDVPLEDIDAVKPKNDSVESLKAQLAEKNKVIEGLNKQLTEVTDRYLALRGEYHNLRVTARNKGWF